MKNKSYVGWIGTFVAIISLFYAIFFKPTLDRLDRIEKDLIQTRLQSEKSVAMLEFMMQIEKAGEKR